MTTRRVDLQDGELRLTDHYEVVVMNLLVGRVTPVLGAGASLYGRAAAPPPTTADDGAVAGETRAKGRWDHAPSATELAAYLARKCKVPEQSADLLRVAQWVYALRGGSGLLYAWLHERFDHDFPPTGLHHFLAEVPALLRDADMGKPPLIVTTNYDDMVERALDDRGEEYDVLVYMAEGKLEGLFCHVMPDGGLEPITDPLSYLEVDPDVRTVILKLHGYVSRKDRRADSYVITEDHYIDYLGRTELGKLVPQPVIGRLGDSNLLFLGYSLRDWNVRAILQYIYNNRAHDNDWWAVQLDPDPLEEKSWAKRNVEIIRMGLEQYIPALRQVLTAELEASAEDE